MISARLAELFTLVAAIALYAVIKPPHMKSVVTGDINATYDYIIVGGGTAGSLLAARLSEDPDVNVLLLEAGGDFTERDEYHVALNHMSMQHSSVDWQYQTVPKTHAAFGLNGRRSYWARGKVLGGTNLLNAAQYARGSRQDYDEWAASGAEGWSYKDVLPYFLKSEDMKIESLKSSKYHNTGGPIAVSDSAVTPLADVLVKAGKELGYKEVDYNGEAQEGFSRNQINVRDGVRSSSALEFLGGAAKGRLNIHVSINSFVTKVVIQDNVATGVQVIMNNRKRFIKATNEVILSAGAINSPQLLMLSGIGPKKHLESLGIDVIKDLPVGENLQDHLILVVQSELNTTEGLTDDKRNSWMTKLRYQLFGTGPLSSSGIEATAFICTQPGHKKGCSADIQYMMLTRYININLIPYYNFAKDVADELSSDGNGQGVCIVLGHLDPKSVGTIKLQSADPFDYPLIDPRYLTHGDDITAFIRGVRIWENLILTPTMQDLGANFDNVKLSKCSQHVFRSDEYWECYIRHIAVTCYHPSGTCKMGKRGDKTAVVDPSLRVIGISGLRVVDASIMPNVTSGNTNAPVTMIAEKAADLIRDKDTVKHLREQLKNIP